MEKNYFNLIQSLKPADVIIAKKKTGLSSILDHYIVYLGNNEFIGNLKGGVKYIYYSEFLELLREYRPVKVRKFPINNPYEIEQAITRAEQKIGQKYSFLGFNCEHFANWVQYGKQTSNQVTNGIVLLISILFLQLIISSNGKR
ncbi:lecithin retinol acyltransferase family protein [Polaribacter marinivivus]|uniref:lecithin retinol acyltransferase family protein n=1 Tax=Polaribacter marinivivus TaxID=1524260 RepID=UPI003D334AB9